MERKIKISRQTIIGGGKVYRAAVLMPCEKVAPFTNTAAWVTLPNGYSSKRAAETAALQFAAQA
jgi:hypothetical protein